jgi:hypothetical protein
MWGSGVGIVVSTVGFAWMVTGGTFQFFQSIPFSNFYDVQARSWLRGTWSMPANVLSIEGIRTGTRTDMYYGPVPSLLRLPVLLFTHRFDGRLTQPSLLLAFVVALLFATLLSWRIRGMLRGPAAVSRIEVGLTAALVVVIGLGSVFFFLGATAMVYEEAELWGAALTLGAFYSLVGFLDRPGAGRLVATGVLTTLAFLTRGSVGAGPLVVIGCAAALYLGVVAAHRSPKWSQRVQRLAQALGVRVAEASGKFGLGLLGALGIPLALYVAVNEIKFSTPFNIPVGRQVISLEDAHRQAVLAANGGSLFGLKFVPTNLLQFARPDALSFTRLFPGIFFPGKALVLGHLLYDTRDWTSSIPASMPVLFILAVIGVVVVYRPARPGRRARSSRVAPGPTGSTDLAYAPGIASLRLPLIGAAVGTVGILTIAFIAERYLADAMPLLLLAALAGWHFVFGRMRTPGLTRTLGLSVLAVLVVFELWTTFSLSLFYQRQLGPAVTIAQRAGLVTFQQQVDRSLFGGPPPGVEFVAQLPRGGTAPNVAVVGQCASVYQYDGNAWQPVELGAAGGARRLEVTFPRTLRGRRQPLLVTGGAKPEDAVALTWEGGDRYHFSFRFAQPLFGHGPGAWYDGPSFTAAGGRPHQVQVDLDTHDGDVYVMVDSRQVFSLLTPVAPPSQVVLGAAPPSLGVAARFEGRIRPLAVSTPLCDQLERDRAAAARPQSSPSRTVPATSGSGRRGVSS